MTQPRSPAHASPPVTLTHQRFQTFDLALLLLDLLLLLFHRIDQHSRNAVVLHTFNFAFGVARNQQWLNGGNVFRPKAEVIRVVGFPFEGDGLELIEQRQSAAKWLQVFLVTKTRGTE